MKIKALFVSAILIFILLPCPVNAKPSLTLSLDRNEADISDSIKMVVKISGSHGSHSTPVIPGLEGFNVTRGGTTKRIGIINGRVDSGVEYTYFIQPEKTGTFQIGPAEVNVKGDTIKSNIEKLKIIERTAPNSIDRGYLFLTADLSSQKAYVEGQIIYTLRLYCQARVSDISLDLPEIEHIAFKQLGKPVESSSNYGGKAYQVLDIRYLLITSKEGNYDIPPSMMHLKVYQPRRRSSRGLSNDPFFSNPFFSTATPVTLTSESLTLNLASLPEGGRPADFSGLVGNFKMNATLSPSEIKAGDSATLTVSLIGRGNVNRFPELKCPELINCKVYADQPVLKVEPCSNGLSGIKTIKWAIVPEKKGRYRIPPLSVSFFDPEDDKYRTVKTPILKLNVLPGKEKLIVSEAGREKQKINEGPVKKEIQELGHDIFPVHTSMKVLREPFGRSRGLLFFLIVFLSPPLIVAITFFALQHRKNSVQSLAAIISKKAARNFIRQIRRESKISANDLTLAIVNYINDRFCLSHGSLTSDEAAEILRAGGADIDTARSLQSVLKLLEDAVYTGRGQEPCDIGADIPKLIRQIEREIR